MAIKVYTIKDQKTIKTMVKFRYKYGHKPLPTEIWRRIHMEIGAASLEVPYVVIGNCDEGKVFIIEGAGTAEEVVTLPLETIAAFPKDVQDIIFEARKSGEYNKVTTRRSMSFNVMTGEIEMWKLDRSH